MDWPHVPDPVAYIVVAGVVAAALTRIGRVVTWLAGWVGDIVTDRVYGDDRAMTPDRVEQIVDDRLVPVVGRHPNGDSLADKIDRLDGKVCGHIDASAADREAMRVRLGSLEERLLFPDERD